MRPFRHLWGVMRILFLLVCSIGSMAQTKQPIEVIAFGSCSRQSADDQMWAEVLRHKPQVWIWGGDNIYGDSHDLAVLKGKYDQQKNRADYQALRSTAAITGTWDDHDFGINDGGKFFAQKNESQMLAADFLDLPANDPVRKQKGLYHSRTFGPRGRQIKVINLDTRYFRDTVNKEYFVDSLTRSRTYRYLVNPTGDILGEAQWTWLEQELTDEQPQLVIINSSIQVISDQHRFEKWANFPMARQRLLNLLARAKSKRLLIISGDRHIAEFSELTVPGLPYPLVDFTSSGLTHTWSTPWEEANPYRSGPLVIQKNFGIIRLNWQGTKPRVTLEIRGHEGSLYATKTLVF